MVTATIETNLADETVIDLTDTTLEELYDLQTDPNPRLRAAAVTELLKEGITQYLDYATIRQHPEMMQAAANYILPRLQPDITKYGTISHTFREVTDELGFETCDIPEIKTTYRGYLHHNLPTEWREANKIVPW